MSEPQLRNSGYSLIELLVVLIIVGILSLAAVTMLGNRRGTAVKSVMNQIEGALVQGQQNAQRGGQDIPLLASGSSWSSASPITLDPSALVNGEAYPASASSAASLASTKRIQRDLERFQYNATKRDHLAAGVAIGSVADTLLTSLQSVVPCNATPFSDAFTLKLFQGTPVMVRISGYSKRFEKGFVIPIVPYVNGTPILTQDVGVIVVPPQSLTVYKFYRPANSTQWSRM